MKCKSVFSKERLQDGQIRQRCAQNLKFEWKCLKNNKYRYEGLLTALYAGNEGVKNGIRRFDPFVDIIIIIKRSLRILGLKRYQCVKYTDSCIPCV